MSESAADMAFAQDLFSGVGRIAPRRMFGGVGLFVGPAMFGLIDEGRVYLRTDAALRADLLAAGAEPWIYAKAPPDRAAGEPGYWSLPESALDDPEEACAWARRALAAAEARKAAAPSKRRKR
jgi:DNA transformation protein